VGLGLGLRGGIAEGSEWVTTPEAAQAAGPIGPVITLPRSITVDGKPFYTGGENISLTPVINWTAPRTGHADYYTLTVRRMFVNGNMRTAAQFVASLITPDTSITLPAGILQAGKAYTFTLDASESTSSTSAQASNAPFKSTLDIADSYTGSNYFFTGPAPAPNPMITSTVIDNQNFAWGITSDAAGIYWTERGHSPWDGSPDNGAGAIWAAGLDGSNPHVLLGNQHTPAGIAVSGGRLYWTNDGDGTVMMLTLGAGHTIVTNNQGTPGTAITAANGSIYWTGAQGAQALFGGALPPDFLGWFGGVNLATDGTNLFWTDYGNGPPDATGHLYTRPIAGGSGVTPVALASGQPQAWDVKVQDGFVYWSDQAWENDGAATIHRIPAGGGTDQVLVTGNELMKTFAVDSQLVYFVNDGILWGVPVAGGDWQFLAPMPSPNGGGCPEGKMILQGTSVYWTDTCGNTPSVIRARRR
jgi:hypothetical protein